MKNKLTRSTPPRLTTLRQRSFIARVTSIALALAVATTVLTGCKDEQGDTVVIPPEDFAYVPTIIPISRNIGDIKDNSIVLFDDKVFFAATTYEYDEETNYWHS